MLLFNRLAQTRQSAQPHQAQLYKQIARIICHIRDNVHRRYPQIIMPTRSMIDALVFNSCNPQKFTGNNWQEVVDNTLLTLKEKTDVGIEGHCHFTLTDGETPLFPNAELFDEWDAHRFSLALIHYLKDDSLDLTDSIQSPNAILETH